MEAAVCAGKKPLVIHKSPVESRHGDEWGSFRRILVSLPDMGRRLSVAREDHVLPIWMCDS